MSPDSDAEEKLVIDLLVSHNYKEENILYPAIDQHTSAEERQALFQQMKEVPEDRYGGFADAPTIKTVALPTEHGASVMLGESLLAGSFIAASANGFSFAPRHIYPQNKAGCLVRRWFRRFILGSGGFDCLGHKAFLCPGVCFVGGIGCMYVPRHRCS